MGFLDRFRKLEKAESQKPAGGGEARYRQPILEIARLISDGDQEVMGEAAECVSDPKRYFEVHIDRYEERGIEDSDDLELIQWLGLVDILESRGWVCERDWKDELGDFLHFMGISPSGAVSSTENGAPGKSAPPPWTLKATVTSCSPARNPTWKSCGTWPERSTAGLTWPRGCNPRPRQVQAQSGQRLPITEELEE